MLGDNQQELFAQVNSPNTWMPKKKKHVKSHKG